MRMHRLRSALKPCQDFCQASCQKTCPYGHKESEDCHSASVPLRCTPSERHSSSRQQYPRLRPGYIKEKRSGDFRLSPPANLATPRFCLRRKSLHLLSKFSPPEVIRLQMVMPQPHRGRMIAFATAVRSGPSPFVAR